MPKFHSLTIADLRAETDDCVSIAFRVPEALQEDYVYQPGQYLTLRAQVDGEDVRRSYSLCSSPVEGEWRVAIKRIPDGKFSTYAHTQLHAGDTLDVMTPTGNFVLTPDPTAAKHYVAFAAGSGITPILSMLKTVLAAEPRSRFTLFYGNRRADSVIFREKIEGLKNLHLGRLAVHYVLSRQHPGSELFYGRIDGERCTRFAQRLFDPQTVDAYYLCGPEPMIRSVTSALQALGVDKANIHFELFTSPLGALGGETRVRAKPQRKILAEVEIIQDAKAFTFGLDSQGETLLDAALKGGADLPYACKGGVCSTCKARVLKGEVEMELNYALEPDEVDAGYVLTCQAHPVSTKVTISFDE